MAKKVKTPEEVQASIEKKIAKRTIFFGTFRKALAVFLGIAFTFAMVQIAFTNGTGSVATGSQSEVTTEQKKVDLAGDESTIAEGETVTDAQGNVTVGLSKADAVKLLNDATAKAANAGYDWSRKCYYTDDGALKVVGSGGGDATDTLDGVIHRVDPNASLGGVVGGFLDITGKDEPLAAKKAKGSSAAPEGMKDKFLLKGMTLTENDIAQFVQTGDVYKFQINSCSDPKKGADNALAHTTNDFVTQEEVASDIAKALGSLSSLITVQSSSIQFSEIVIVAEIKGGSLTSLSIDYVMEVKSLDLKVFVTNVVGSGKGKVETVYNNFVY